MDVFAHALWAGAGIILARRRWRISPRVAALTVAMAVMPDIPHLVPIVGWSVFGDGSAAVVQDYANAVAGQTPSAPALVDSWSHNLYCITHSAVVAGLVTSLIWFRRRMWMVPLLGWWSHVAIDVFTHSRSRRDDYIEVWVSRKRSWPLNLLDQRKYRYSIPKVHLSCTSY